MRTCVYMCVYVCVYMCVCVCILVHPTCMGHWRINVGIIINHVVLIYVYIAQVVSLNYIQFVFFGSDSK